MSTTHEHAPAVAHPMPASDDLGSERQGSLIKRLAKELGFASTDDALGALGMRRPLSVSQAREAITEFLARQKARAGTELPQSGGARKYLTARHLREIDEGARRAPAELDADAEWVIDRLAKLRKVYAAVGADGAPTCCVAAVNAGGPIEVRMLVDYFGSIEQVAAAFDVSVGSAKQWGTHLPRARAYEAQVKTNGYVVA